MSGRPCCGHGHINRPLKLNPPCVGVTQLSLKPLSLLTRLQWELTAQYQLSCSGPTLEVAAEFALSCGSLRFSGHNSPPGDGLSLKLAPSIDCVPLGV